jgi:putative endonuclease
MSEKYFLYVLRSQKNERLYTGSTDNVERRLSEHNARKNLATKHAAPFVLLHTETFLSRVDAVKREQYLKTGLGRQELKRLLLKEESSAG